MRRPHIDELLRAGLTGTFVRAIPAGTLERLLGDAIQVDLPSGSVVYREGDHPTVLVVVTGLLRAYLESVDGRQVTVRYARAGDVAGLALLVDPGAPLTIEAVTPTSVLALRRGTITALLEADPVFARACAAELTHQLRETLDDLARQAFLSVEQRLAGRLLELSEPDEDDRLVVRASQQQLANAVGSVREVVARALHVLREEGLVETARDRVIVIDPAALALRASVDGESAAGAPARSGAARPHDARPA